MDLKKSPLAPKNFPRIPEVKGVSMSTSLSGLKYKGRPDLLLVKLKSNTSIAGVLTKSSVPGCPVVWCRNKLPKGKAQALFVNSGNANVFTGREGEAAVEEIARAVSATLKCPINSVFMASTGVIGEILDYRKIIKKIPKMSENLKERNWNKAATAITTTDTFSKGAYSDAIIGNKKIRIAGIAKGSGMIAPNMATMLSFIFTDANIPSDILQSLLSRNVTNTFNAITVDSDTSTNDMVAIFATGKVKTGKFYNVLDPKLKDFELALQKVLLNLAKQIVSDGEGAKKFVVVKVVNARSINMAKNIAFSVANSPLFKTAMAAEDPNWGRIVMGIGKSGETVSPEKIEIKIGEFKVAEKGKVYENIDEKKIKEYMQWESITIEINLKLGQANYECYTCDFTKDYIDLNADYRS